MLPKWCSAARPGSVGRRRGRRRARLSVITLVENEVVHPIRRHYTPSDRVYRDGSGVSRRNRCSATEQVQRVTSPVLTAPVCASRSYVRQRSSRDAPEDNEQQGRGPSRVARAPPIAVRPARSSRGCCDDRRAHQMRSVVTGWRNAHKR